MSNFFEQLYSTSIPITEPTKFTVTLDGKLIGTFSSKEAAEKASIKCVAESGGIFVDGERPDGFDCFSGYLHSKTKYAQNYPIDISQYTTASYIIEKTKEFEEAKYHPKWIDKKDWKMYYSDGTV